MIVRKNLKILYKKKLHNCNFLGCIINSVGEKIFTTLFFIKKRHVV